MSMSDVSALARFHENIYYLDKCQKVVGSVLGGLLGRILEAQYGPDADVVKGLMEIKAEIGGVRAANRLFGSSAVIDALNADGGSDWKDSTIATVSKLDNLVLLVYYIAENTSWFGSVGKSFFGKYVDGDSLVKAVCYGWCASIALNICKHVLMLRELGKERLQAGQQGDTAKLRDYDGRIKGTQVALLRWCLFFPPALGWCVPGGLFSGTVDDLFGGAEAVIDIYWTFGNYRKSFIKDKDE